MRTDGRPLIVSAIQRDAPDAPDRQPHAQQLRLSLFNALTGARIGGTIVPSVTSGEPLNGYAPIDRAVLRAIFAHDDWSGRSYDDKIKLLTARVMEQLAANP